MVNRFDIPITGHTKNEISLAKSYGKRVEIDSVDGRAVIYKYKGVHYLVEMNIKNEADFTLKQSVGKVIDMFYAETARHRKLKEKLKGSGLILKSSPLMYKFFDNQSN